MATELCKERMGVSGNGTMQIRSGIDTNPSGSLCHIIIVEKSTTRTLIKLPAIGRRTSEYDHVTPKENRDHFIKW